MTAFEQIELRKTNALRGGNKRKSKYEERKLEAERSETMKLWPASVILDDNEEFCVECFFPPLSNTNNHRISQCFVLEKTANPLEIVDYLLPVFKAFLGFWFQIVTPHSEPTQLLRSIGYSHWKIVTICVKSGSKENA